jgi:hypothetical protein
MDILFSLVVESVPIHNLHWLSSFCLGKRSHQTQIEEGRLWPRHGRRNELYLFIGVMTDLLCQGEVVPVVRTVFPGF